MVISEEDALAALTNCTSGRIWSPFEAAMANSIRKRGKGMAKHSQEEDGFLRKLHFCGGLAIFVRALKV